MLLDAVNLLLMLLAVTGSDVFKTTLKHVFQKITVLLLQDCAMCESRLLKESIFSPTLTTMSKKVPLAAAVVPVPLTGELHFCWCPVVNRGAGEQCFSWGPGLKCECFSQLQTGPSAIFTGWKTPSPGCQLKRRGGCGFIARVCFTRRVQILVERERSDFRR